MAAIWGNAAVEYRGRGWRGYLRNLLLYRATYLDSLKLDEDAMQHFAARLQRRPRRCSTATPIRSTCSPLSCRRGYTDIRPAR